MMRSDVIDRQVEAVAQLAKALLMERFAGQVTLRFSDGGVQPQVDKVSRITLKV